MKNIKIDFPVIFLDIDGVLNNTEEKVWLSPKCLTRLSALCRETAAKVVLISNWKRGYKETFDKCSERIKVFLRECDRAGVRVIDKTFDFYYNRGHGIVKYIIKNDVKQWVILDDKMYSDYVGQLAEKLILTSRNTGLSDDNVYAAKQILLGK